MVIGYFGNDFAIIAERTCRLNKNRRYVILANKYDTWTKGYRF
jgi:hypothetical protein